MPTRELYRLLVTGSRSWDDEQTILDAVAAVVADRGSQNVVLVHGACEEGADAIADRVASIWASLTVERHPADWAHCADYCHPAHRRSRRDGTTYCPAAGLRRDAHMVELGAGLLLAFIDRCTKPACRRRKAHGSHGASHTVRLAQRAGIPVRRWTR